MAENSGLPFCVALPDRAVVRVAGADARGFLQGLVSNDIDRVSPDRAVYAALLTPQGKYLHDFFVFERDGVLSLDGAAGRLDDLLRRLRMYKLRARVEIEVDEEARVFALIGDGALDAAGLTAEPGRSGRFAGGVAFTDPRLAAIGARAVLAADADGALAEAGFEAGDWDAYEARRVALGLPDSGRDLIAEKSLLLEYGFDDLNGVDFEKGCYVGQEVTARMKHRKLVRKRLLPVTIEGPAPASGTPILRGDVEVGETFSTCGANGLAMLKLDHVRAAADSGEKFTADGAKIVPRKPGWARY